MKKTTRRTFLVETAGGVALLGLEGCKHRFPRGVPMTVPGGAAASGDDAVAVRTRVNGVAREVTVRAEESALDALRERLGLKGAKRGCGQGACGACTIHVDSEPVASCLLPATALEGREVATVEGLPDGPHPVQRAFMANDALQCGFCTPGFVMAAAAYHDRHRAERGTEEPTRDEIAAALAGNLCRCGAYEGIYAAVRDACAGRFDAPLPMDGPRRDAREKVTGTAVYTTDVTYPNMLEGRVLRSPHAHARVRSIDLSDLAGIAGLRAVVRMLGKDSLIRHAGQAIVAVAALDRATADEAVRRIKVDYEALPHTLGIDAARKPDSEPVYPKRKRYAQTAGEGPKVPAPRFKGNVRGPFTVFGKHGGRADHALADARTAGAPVVEGTWQTQAQCHTAMEPHGCVAVWEEGGLTLHVSTQAVVRVNQDAAHRWELPESRVRVHASYVGGGFGAKAALTPEIIAAVDLARAAGAPVRVVLDRREELLLGGYRPPTRIELSLAATKEGTFRAMKVRAYGDAGVAVGNSVTPFMRLHYDHRHAPKSLKEWDITTHAPPGQPFRGPGGPPGYFAVEQAVDELAAKLSMDPIAMRRKWDTNPPRIALYDWAEKLDVWARRGAARDRGRHRRGIGLATGTWLHFPQVDSQAEVGVEAGVLYAASSTQDMGNGTRTVMAIALAELFGLPAGDVDVRIGDSRHVRGPMSAGSRTTGSIVPTVHQAGRELREQLAAELAASRGLRGARVTDTGIVHDGGTVSWRDALAAARPQRVVARRPKKGEKHALPISLDVGGKVNVGRHLTGAVQIAEVEVDTRLGRVRVVEMWGGYGAGRIVCPELARSQAAGGVIQGIGYALYEERHLDPLQGLMLSATLDSYLIPGIGDVPPITTHFHEEGFELALERIVGLAELVTLPTSAAIANAVAHATGFRPRELPIRIDRVLAGVKA